MNPKWLDLAADLLEQSSDEFSNHGCNDWDFPKSWTTEEQQEFVKAMHEDNGDPEEYDPDHLSVPDWWVMLFLSKTLRSEATKPTHLDVSARGGKKRAARLTPERLSEIGRSGARARLAKTKTQLDHSSTEAQ